MFLVLQEEGLDTDEFNALQKYKLSPALKVLLHFSLLSELNQKLRQESRQHCTKQLTSAVQVLFELHKDSRFVFFPQDCKTF